MLVLLSAQLGHVEARLSVHLGLRDVVQHISCRVEHWDR